MKKSLLILLVFSVLTSTGCRYFQSVQPAETPQPVKPVEEPQPVPEEDLLPEIDSEPHISDDFSLLFPEGTITLLAYEDEMNLTETLGMPLVEEALVLENADTFTGSHQKTLTYRDTKLVLFSPPKGDQRFYLINIETENDDVSTNRGITLGDTLEHLQQSYPEVIRSLDGTTGNDGRYEMMFQNNPYTYLFFYVEEGKVVKIQLLHEFA